MKILVIGSLNMDTTYSLSHIPKEGETIISSKKTVQRGGKGQNQAIQIGRLGCDITMIGAVGDDPEGKILLEGLKEDGVDPDSIFIKKGSTGTASIYVDKKGQNNIVVFPGANFEITVEDIEKNSDLIKSADIVVLQNEIPLEVNYKVIELCNNEDTITVYNPAPANKNFKKEYLGMVDYFLPNETEIEIILDREIGEDYEEIAREALELGCKNVIITLGKTGSLLVNKEKTHLEPAKVVKAVDTTAAGDSYIGGFVAGLAAGLEVEGAMELATRVAAITVTRPGAVDSLPTKVEVEKA